MFVAVTGLPICIAPVRCKGTGLRSLVKTLPAATLVASCTSADSTEMLTA
jgi:hypothetical protein